MKFITSIIFSASFAIATSVSIPHVQAQELNQPQANTAQEKLNTTTKPQGFCFVTPWGRMCGG